MTVEVVQPVENPSFCMACHRLRLTSDGRLKGCLMTNDGLLDLRALLRSGAPETALVQAFEKAIARRRPFFVSRDAISEPALGSESEGEEIPLPMASARALHS